MLIVVAGLPECFFGDEMPAMSEISMSLVRPKAVEFQIQRYHIQSLLKILVVCLFRRLHFLRR